MIHLMTDFTTRPVIQGTRGVVTAGHYLAATAGFRMMEQGGNAIDASAAMVFALNLLEPHNAGLGGEVPTLIYSAKDRKVHALSGQGSAPKDMSIAWFQRAQLDVIPGDGMLPAMVPAVVGTWAEALARFGTMTFAQVLQPALELAEEGFPMYPDLHDQLVAQADRYRREYPGTAKLYLPGSQPPAVGELFSNPEWGAVLRRMIEAERGAQKGNRAAGIEAARAEFYTGETGARIAEFVAATAVTDATGRPNKGFMTRGDLAAWRAKVETPATFKYRGIDVFKCGPWCQGPVFLQQLALLDGFDLKTMAHNSPEYLHTWIECAKLAFADREAYYGDPEFDKVPLDALLSKEYNDTRRALIEATASQEFRPGEVPNGRDLTGVHDFTGIKADNEYARAHAHDTTHCDAIDRFGNMVAATPSGGWIQSSPVIPGLGFCLGTRGQMFSLNPKRANALAPGKRPRTTLTPSMAMKDGSPWMAWGTQGGDHQDQWTLQFFLNVVEFGMDLQEAIDAPTVHTNHFPSSFYPRGVGLNKMNAEGRVPADVLAALTEKGHEVSTDPDWSHGRVLAVRINPNGVMEAAASPRLRIAYALGW